MTSSARNGAVISGALYAAILVAGCTSGTNDPTPSVRTDAGTLPEQSDAGSAWREAKTCAGGSVSLKALSQADCERISSIWGQCSGADERCIHAVDEADCRARDCSWSSEPKCQGTRDCYNASTSALCELLPGCTVTERRGMCVGVAGECETAYSNVDCQEPCAWNSDNLTCEGAYTCSELSLATCHQATGCNLEWASEGEPDAIPFPDDDCRGDADCEDSEWCERGACLAKLAEDAWCERDGSCASGQCRVRYDRPEYAGTKACAPAPDCSLPDCTYCREREGKPTCYDACDGPDKPCALCGCDVNDHAYCDEAADACLPKFEVESACSVDAQCLSGRCGAPANDPTRNVCLVRGGEYCDPGNCENCYANICLAHCDRQSDCREGYSCVKAGIAYGTCLRACDSGQSCTSTSSYQGECLGKQSFTEPDEFVLVCVPPP